MLLYVCVRKITLKVFRTAGNLTSYKSPGAVYTDSDLKFFSHLSALIRDEEKKNHIATVWNIRDKSV